MQNLMLLTIAKVFNNTTAEIHFENQKFNKLLKHKYKRHKT